MKNLIYIFLLLLFCVNLAFSQNASHSTDTSKNGKNNSKLSDSTKIHKCTTDKFIDSDGDGINDARCGKSMGLGKGLGKQNYEPGKVALPDKNSINKIDKKEKK